jgi:ATP-binding cassette subfamily B protein
MAEIASEGQADPESARPVNHVQPWRLAAAEVARVLRFALGALWEAAPAHLLLFLALGLINGFVPILQVWATKALVDALTSLALSSPPHLLTSSPPHSPLLWLATLIAAMVIRNGIDAGTPLLTAILNEQSKQTLERRLYEKSLSLRLIAFESPDYYDRLARARDSLSGETAYALEVSRCFLSGVIGMLGIAAIVAQVAWPLALLLLLGSVPLALVTAWQERAFVRVRYGQSPLKRRLAYWRDLSTKRGPAAELRLFGLGDHFREQWRDLQDRLNRELVTALRPLVWRSQSVGWGTAILTGVVMAGVLYAGTQGAASAGTLVGTLYALHQFEGMRDGLLWQIRDLNNFYTGFRDLVAFMVMGGEERVAGVPAPSPIRQGIVFENVSFTYPGSATPALSGIDLCIHPGERLALVGENGAGKSTLARLLLGLYEPTEGRIRVDGLDLAEIAPASWRAQVAAVFQEFVQYPLTVRENIGFGDVRALADTRRIQLAAEKSGAHEVVQHLPHGYDTLLGKGFEGAHELSVGQWQKLALARAYLRDAPVLILDEPAAALDALAERDVYERFRDVSEGKTMLLISHRLGSARLADRIVFLERGRIAQMGSHDALIEAGGPYAEMYALQAEWYRE